MSGELTQAVADLEEEKAIKLVQEKLDKGEDPNTVLAESREGMEIVGKRFGEQEYFLPELIYSAEIFKQITEIIKPKIQTEGPSGQKLGKVVIGTVAGDIHDIGKDIVSFMLDISGFEVFDLGVDIPPQQFVDKIKETNAPIVALSGFLTLAFDSMKETVEAIKALRLDKKMTWVSTGGGAMLEFLENDGRLPAIEALRS